MLNFDPHQTALQLKVTNQNIFYVHLFLECNSDSFVSLFLPSTPSCPSYPEHLAFFIV